MNVSRWSYSSSEQKSRSNREASELASDPNMRGHLSRNQSFAGGPRILRTTAGFSTPIMQRSVATQVKTAPNMGEVLI